MEETFEEEEREIIPTLNRKKIYTVMKNFINDFNEEEDDSNIRTIKHQKSIVSTNIPEYTDKQFEKIVIPYLTKKKIKAKNITEIAYLLTKLSENSVIMSVGEIKNIMSLDNVVEAMRKALKMILRAFTMKGRFKSPKSIAAFLLNITTYEQKKILEALNTFSVSLIKNVGVNIDIKIITTIIKELSLGSIDKLISYFGALLPQIMPLFLTFLSSF